jgi:hypothetical protein
MTTFQGTLRRRLTPARLCRNIYFLPEEEKVPPFCCQLRLFEICPLPFALIPNIHAHLIRLFAIHRQNQIYFTAAPRAGWNHHV